MINGNKLILFLLFLLIIAIPVSFAGDIDNNVTIKSTDNQNLLNIPISEDMDELNSSDDEILGDGDVYFDASAVQDGDGSQSNPYKTVSSSKLGATNHFKAGTYTISSSISSSFSFSSNAMKFIGEDRDSTILNYIGTDAFMTTSSDVTFSTITLKGCNFVSTGGLFTAENTIFDGGVAQVEEEADHTYYDNSYGGAIKQSISSSSFDWGSIFGGGSSTRGMKITDCVFKNNYASYGGAIYVEGGTCEITNTRFESNIAKHYGGSIAALNGVKLTVNNCEFVNDESTNDAAGGIYLYNVSDAAVKSSNFNDLKATFGPAIVSLMSTVAVDNSSFNKNRASWQGGAIYAMYGSLTITSSTFIENQAKNGGAVFADNLTYFEVDGGKFEKNIAEDTAGAIFAFTNKVNRISTAYNSNRASNEENLYQSDKIDLIMGSDDYEMIQYKSDYAGQLPSKYDLRTTGGVTPVENQGQSGNCWAFATMATLESAILKATGKQFDLSEGNLKNLACRFSDIGWDYETNNGGMYPFVLGYLTSWAGPVNASMDPTDDWDLLSPILNSVVHVQNILFLQRTSFTDNSAIKKAIMDYGAVCSEIYWQNSYNGGGSDCYYSGEPTRNHAISVIGWDDNRAISGAPGKGAWIIKNSYGPARGDGGYYYVSYYDTSLFRVYDESYNSFAIVFNDTLRFNKNYQYDAAFTDYFMTGESEMWYKNTFTSTGNDILSAFSTYFRKVTDWQANIYVNDELKLVQDGKSNFGYYTINLDNPLQLKTGDNFTISLKIKCSSSADIPISEHGPAYTLVKEYFKPGISYFSKDGLTWTDFYNYKGTYGSGETGHNYFNQVACLKAFTTEGQKEFLNTTLEITNVNSSCVEVTVTDQNGGIVNYGTVEFIIDSVKYSSRVVLSKAILNTYMKSGSHNIQAEYLANQYYNSSTDSKSITIDKEIPKIEITASDIFEGENLNVIVKITNGNDDEINLPVTVKVNDVEYTQKEISISGLTSGKYAITVNVSENSDFTSYSVSKTIEVKKKSQANVEIRIYDLNDPSKTTITSNGDYNADIAYEIIKSDGEFTDESLEIFVNNQSVGTNTITPSSRLGKVTFDEDNEWEIYVIYTATVNNQKISKMSNKLIFITKDTSGNVNGTGDEPIPTGNFVIRDANYPNKSTILLNNEYGAVIQYYVELPSGSLLVSEIKIYVNGNYFKAFSDLENKKFTSIDVEIPIKDNGDYVITAVYDYYVFMGESGQRTSNSLTYKLSISNNNESEFIAPTLSIDVENVTYPNQATALIKSNVDGVYIIKFNGENHEVTVNNGVGLFKFNPLTGNHTIEVMSKTNSSVKNSTRFSVLKVKINADKVISSEVNSKNATFAISLPEDAIGTFTVRINEKSYDKKLENGKAIINVDDLENNEYNAIISYSGDTNYDSFTKTMKIIVNDTTASDNGTGSNSSSGNSSSVVNGTGGNSSSGNESDITNQNFNSIDAVDMTRGYKSTYDFKAVFYDKNGAILSNSEVLFIINGNEYAIKTDEYGVAKLNCNLVVGRYSIIIYNPSTGEQIVRNLSIVDRITGNRNINIDYTFKSTYKVRLYADNGQVVGAGEAVVITLNNVKYTAFTDKNGYASIVVSGLTPKTYNITAEYKGVSVSNKIVVKHVLKAKNAKFKKSKKVKKYKVSLKTSSGKAIKGKKITLKIKGKTYTSKTNKKGVATFKIKNLKKVGKFKATVKYLKSTIKKTITVRR